MVAHAYHPRMGKYQDSLSPCLSGICALKVLRGKSVAAKATSRHIFLWPIVTGQGICAKRVEKFREKQRNMVHGKEFNYIQKVYLALKIPGGHL